jgi:hypothetical protein
MYSSPKAKLDPQLRLCLWFVNQVKKKTAKEEKKHEVSQRFTKKE